jgi:hypothetical protein
LGEGLFQIDYDPQEVRWKEGAELDRIVPRAA